MHAPIILPSNTKPCIIFIDQYTNKLAGLHQHFFSQNQEKLNRYAMFLFGNNSD